MSETETWKDCPECGCPSQPKYVDHCHDYYVCPNCGNKYWGDYAPIEERVAGCPHCFRACQCVGFKEEYSADVPGVPFLREKYVCPNCGEEFFGVTDLEAMKRAGIELPSWYFK